eukprot:g2980.t1
MTVECLERDRNMFWESRHGGVPQCWAVLRRAAEALLEEDIDLANTYLSAADMKTPLGTLAVSIDPLLNKYEVPRFVYSNPSNIMMSIQSSKSDKDKKQENQELLKGEKESSSNNDFSKLDKSEFFTVVVRIVNTSYIVPISLHAKMNTFHIEDQFRKSVSTFVSETPLPSDVIYKIIGVDKSASVGETKIELSEENKNNKKIEPCRIRLFFQGKEIGKLSDECTVSSCGIEKNAVIQAYLVDK